MKINKVPSKTKSTILVLVDNKHVLTFPIQVLMPKPTVKTQKQGSD